MNMQVLSAALVLFMIYFVTSCDGSPLFKATRKTWKKDNTLRFRSGQNNLKSVTVLQTDMDDTMADTTENVISSNVQTYDDLADCMRGIQNDLESDFGIGWSVILVDSDANWTWSVYKKDFMYAQAETYSGDEWDVLVFSKPEE